MTRSDCLENAKEIVNGKRQQEYGTVEDNFGVIAEFWTTYLGHIVKIEPDDVANMMSLMKIARISTGGGTVDSYVDLAGYAACGCEVFTEMQHRKAFDVLDEND